MKDNDKKNKRFKARIKEKNQGNNQWTNNNLKFYPDNTQRRDGPGGENGDEAPSKLP